MIHGKLKYITIGVIALVALVVLMVVYRMYFKFNRKKIAAYAEAIAAATASPNLAYQLLIEGCEFILKSQDMTKQVEILSEVEGIDKERALVLTALNNCYASGFIEKPTEVPVTNE